ncbi:Uma2 family endonuclease [Anabaena subtropica]|uniref:Uma2 family endonuclease n=1 Tax=Anabaena subtropica FACHB-260 TaxID=2692884 RepID=A0ABR8CVT6_9NOST|nr:Uma2 family endonuclease [Anabaena subtropica]MBD2346347.1 Uma2 family endonuclease [Anabaena subtropica FACHB-260]
MNLVVTKRFTVDEYHRLEEIGFFAEKERVELIKGEIFQMVAKGTPHTACLTRLYRELFKLMGEQATLRGQEPISISQYSEPEPDMVIVKNTPDDYLKNHPLPSDVLLLIEIADSSVKYDQEIKLPVYAEAGIADYWILNLVDDCLECYSEPYQDLKGKFGYRHKLIYLPNESVHLPSFPNLSLDLLKVFPS